jgi:hypothetical protein
VCKVADPRGVTGVDRHDARRVDDGRGGQVGTLRDVGSHRSFLEIDRRLLEARVARGRIAVVEFGRGPRLRSEPAADEVDVVVLLGRHYPRVLHEVSAQGATAQRGVVEGGLRLLQKQQEPPDARVLAGRRPPRAGRGLDPAAEQRARADHAAAGRRGPQGLATGRAPHRPPADRSLTCAWNSLTSG